LRPFPTKQRRLDDLATDRGRMKNAEKVMKKVMMMLLHSIHLNVASLYLKCGLRATERLVDVEPQHDGHPEPHEAPERYF